MQSVGFRRFVAVFVGILLIVAVVICIVTGDEALVGTVLLVAALYAFYLTKLIKKEKELKAKQPEKKSPLLRR